MQIQLQFLACRFTQDQKTGYLDTAACTSCTGSHKHKDNQNSLRKYRPHIEICGSISSSRNDGSHLESSLLESSSKACEHFSCINSDSYNGQANNPQIVTYLFILGCLHYFLRQKQIIGIKVDSKKNHKDRDHHLIIRAVACNTVIFDTKTTGTCGTKTKAQCIKQRHFSNEKENDLHNSQNNVYGIQNLGCGLYLRHQFADRRSRALCFHQIHVISTGKRQQAENKYQYSHSANPVGKASPDQHTVRQSLHITQNTGSSRGKTGNSLKYCIYRMGNTSRNNKRKRSCNTEYQPAESNCNSTLFGMEYFAFSFPPGKRNSNCQTDQHRDQKCQTIFFPVNDCCNSWQNHKCRFKIEDPAKNIRYHGIIHVWTPLLCKYIVDITKASVSGNNYNSVSNLQGIMSTGNAHTAIPVKTSNQKILLQIQFGQCPSYNR